MADVRLNQIRIKTGILKRETKEKFVCEREVETERKRLEAMKNDNRDPHDLRKQEEVINETLMMIPDSTKRIHTAFTDLTAILQETEAELSETAEFQAAKALIQELQQMFP